MYFQIGLLVLIGLGAKNAVLRVSAAVEFRHEGKSIMEATVLAGEQRLRPIIMTSLAFAVGVLPLALATGAGANARHSIGTGIIGGMIGETTLAMLYVPLFFYLFDRLAEGKDDAEPATPRAGGGHADAAPHGATGRATDMRRLRWSPAPAQPLLAGCMIGPNYARPKVDAPADFRFEPKATAETANTEWWKQFDDPVLDALIAEALANNVNVKIAAANVEQAAGLLTQTRSRALPAGRVQRRSGERAKRAEYRARIGDSQLSESAIELPGAAERELGNRPLGPHPAPERSRPARTCWPPTTRAAASSCRWSRRWRTITSSCAVSMRSSPSPKRRSARTPNRVKLFELQFKYGQVSQMNVAQAQSQYENAAAQIPQIESQIAQTENALSMLLGRNPGPIARGKTHRRARRCRPFRPALPSELARAPARSAAGGAAADRRQRADRRGEGAVLSRRFR